MAQSKNTKFDEDNLYHKALLAVLEKRASDYINIAERKSLYNVIIAKEIRAIEMPQEIKEFKIDYLDGEELYRKFIEYKKTKSKDERDELKIMFVHPMKNKGSKIEVRFTDHWYRRKKNNTFLALEGGSIVTFVFDCKTEKFIVENVELWGV
ncbi:MAG: hypothetical protein ACR2MD_19605 [Aridibacter sp.]